MRKLIKRLGTKWPTVSPYVVLLTVVPGGAILALFLFLHRRKRVSYADHVDIHACAGRW